ncbi:hypothetical protein SEUCBS140593_009703 [Sporothrix eucalyptigena]|uniref:Dihydroxyacetone kinase n=1 Tax=Sporothrix eucalyptigena TaxID=1812306 RepID=A0ABP0CYP6_9PEZI
MAQHFYDDDDSPVFDALASLALMRPNVSFDRAQKVIYRTSHNADTSVALISGGGAGHEPAHAGYVGDGALTAAVSGFIFASPSVAQIVSAIQRVGGSAGVLLIIKNYTGDVFHFHLAAEKAKAAVKHIPVEVLVVGDDVAVGRAQSGKVGRRGLAGTVLVHKILGALSEQGTPLPEVRALGQDIVANLVTVGTSLGHVHIPGRASDEAVEASNDAELGMGIHNEPGCRVLSPRPSLTSLIDTMLDQLLDETDADRAYVTFSDKAASDNIVLLVNNLGGVSPLEFGGITANVVRALAKRGIRPVRSLSGTYMTSLNGPGFSITLLRATSQMVQLLDAPTTAVNWIPATNIYSDASEIEAESASAESEVEEGAPSGILLDRELFQKAVAVAAANVISQEATITKHDRIVGDGDCGVTLARGAKAAASFAASLPTAETTDAVTVFRNLTAVVENNMDGTSGALYSIFFAALTAALAQQTSGQVLGFKAWSAAVSEALARLQQATPARQGDRTLMDGLEPFVYALAKSDGSPASLTAAVAAAKAGVEATKGMKASLGRSVYVEASNWEAVPDPGAVGVLAILEGIVSALS